MSFESELSELIATTGLPAPDVGERRETAWPKIIAAFGLLVEVLRAAQAVCDGRDNDFTRLRAALAGFE